MYSSSSSPAFTATERAARASSVALRGAIATARARDDVDVTFRAFAGARRATRAQRARAIVSVITFASFARERGDALGRARRRLRPRRATRAVSMKRRARRAMTFRHSATRRAVATRRASTRRENDARAIDRAGSTGARSRRAHETRDRARGEITESHAGTDVDAR
jgi:hypothetical protein